MVSLSPQRNNLSSSAQAIANNDHLLTQILLCLPMKSLFRFKCVSNHWLSLISDPHLFNFNYCPSGLLLTSTWTRSISEFQFIKLDASTHHSDYAFETPTFLNPHQDIIINQSCNGLFLCFIHSSSPSQEEDYVYSPITNQYAILPPISIPGKKIISGEIYLAFDPSKSPHYKVICVCRFNVSSKYDYEICIYSSKTRLWRESSARFCLERGNGLERGVFWNGALHWDTYWGPLICFDVDKEQVREIPMPPKPDHPRRRTVSYFGKSREHLHVVEIYDASSTKFDVWELEKDYSGWSVKYRVDLDGVVSAFPGMFKDHLVETNPDLDPCYYYVFQIMYIFGGESDEDSYMVLNIPQKILQYKFKDKSFKVLCDFASARNENGGDMVYYCAYEYIKSFPCV